MSNTVLALDPGPQETAWVIWSEDRIERFGKSPNDEFVDAIMTKLVDADRMVIEKIASYGMPVGAEVFETCVWSGRFIQAFYAHLKPVRRIGRLEVKMHLCHDSRAKDANIRQALIDRFGGKERAIGKKNSPGPLYGISGDCWAALAVAITFHDQYCAENTNGDKGCAARR